MATGPLAPVVRYLRQVTSTAAFGELPDAELLARFARQRDEAAFTALVRRHGPMVLAVCRRVVHDGHAAEDAFQATFLVLARKAASLAQPELLSNWLHGVAYRTALKARREAAKRRAYETQAVRAQEVGPSEEIDEQELRAVLDEEVNRLPERYRVPVVLCYLQGQTNAEAARRLGCSRGTVATLLARARDKLRRRLTQRGITLGTLMPAVRGETVPLALANVTVKAAALLSAGHTQAVGALAVQAVALAKGVSKAMLIEKLKIPAAILIVTALVGTGAGVGVYCTDAPGSEVAEAAREAKPGPQNKSEDQKRSDDKRSGERSHPPQAAPAVSEDRQSGHPPVFPHVKAVAKHSFQGKLPGGPPPFIILAVLDEDGHLTVRQNITYYEPATEEVTLKNGQKQLVAYYEEKYHSFETVYPIDAVRVYDSKGRRIDAKDLRKRLKGETLAFMTANGRPIDPLQLQLYKEDTLVFVMPPRAPRVLTPPPGVNPPPASRVAPQNMAPPAVVPPSMPPHIVPPPAVGDPRDSAPPSIP